jgi:hypothetical protein
LIIKSYDDLEMFGRKANVLGRGGTKNRALVPYGRGVDVLCMVSSS